ncbi:MAG: phosphoadenylyl-sulfate reductase [Candidatus Vogelbacteria bacterium]|nr:phosphoadenylyl-sulfate reductase [Candidatus Vogelbacteria bacterium]
MNLTQKVELSKIIIDNAIRRHPKSFVACSFGKDSRVLVDLIMAIDPNFHFIGIDTGYEFPETMQFGEDLVKETGMNFRWVTASPEERAQIDAAYGDSFIKNDQYKCCEMKIPAIEAAMKGYDAWFTGLRRDETEYRQNIRIFEPGKIVKVNPIAFWDKDDVWSYIKENGLSYHPLYDAGYASLGCKPCTTEGKVRAGGGRQGQFERAGRFGGTTNVGGECGLHTM